MADGNGIGKRKAKGKETEDYFQESGCAAVYGIYDVPNSLCSLHSLLSLPYTRTKLKINATK